MFHRSLLKLIILSGMVGPAAQRRNIAAKKLKQPVDARFNVGSLENPNYPIQPVHAWAQAGMRREIGSQERYKTRQRQPKRMWRCA